MLVQEVFCLLLPILSSFEPTINKWIRQSRLNKPKIPAVEITDNTQIAIGNITHLGCLKIIHKIKISINIRVEP